MGLGVGWEGLLEWWLYSGCQVVVVVEMGGGVVGVVEVVVEGGWME